MRGVWDSTPSARPYVLVPMVAYVTFVVLSWVANPLFNLLLRVSKFGRQALSHDDIVATNWFGGCGLVAIAACGIFAATWNELWLIAAAGAGCMLIPIAGTFGRAPGRPRNRLAAYTLGLATVGLTALGLGFADHGMAGAVGVVFLVGVVAFQWIANLVAIRH